MKAARIIKPKETLQMQDLETPKPEFSGACQSTFIGRLS